MFIGITYYGKVVSLSSPLKSQLDFFSYFGIQESSTNLEEIKEYTASKLKDKTGMRH